MNILDRLDSNFNITSPLINLLSSGVLGELVYNEIKRNNIPYKVAFLSAGIMLTSAYATKKLAEKIWDYFDRERSQLRTILEWDISLIGAYFVLNEIFSSFDLKEGAFKDIRVISNIAMGIILASALAVHGTIGFIKAFRDYNNAHMIRMEI